MKVTKERNPYLKRIISHEPHKFSYHYLYKGLISILESIFYCPLRVNNSKLIKRAPSSPSLESTFLVLSRIRKDTKLLPETHQFCIMPLTWISSTKIHITLQCLTNLQDILNFLISFANNFPIICANRTKQPAIPWKSRYRKTIIIKNKKRQSIIAV